MFSTVTAMVLYPCGNGLRIVRVIILLSINTLLHFIYKNYMKNNQRLLGACKRSPGWKLFWKKENLKLFIYIKADKFPMGKIWKYWNFTLRFQKSWLKCKIPIGSNVNLCLAMAAILNGARQNPTQFLKRTIFKPMLSLTSNDI